MTDIAERTIDTPSRTLADPPPAKPEGNPGLIALPLIIAGATGLGFINTGIINVAAAAVPILLSATAIGLLVTMIWSAALSQNINATIYGTFFGFYGSYAVLSLGLTHNWFGIPDTGVQQTVALWLGSWLLTIDPGRTGQAGAAHRRLRDLPKLPRALGHRAATAHPTRRTPRHARQRTIHLPAPPTRRPAVRCRPRFDAPRVPVRRTPRYRSSRAARCRIPMATSITRRDDSSPAPIAHGCHRA